MSISPPAGQQTVASSGIIHMAGEIPGAPGTLARTSNLPYRCENPPPERHTEDVLMWPLEALCLQRVVDSPQGDSGSVLR